jgi:hypothetical protein
MTNIEPPDDCLWWIWPQTLFDSSWNSSMSMLTCMLIALIFDHKIGTHMAQASTAITEKPIAE